MPGEDQIAIATPEQIRLEFPIAGLGSRFIAICIDMLIFIALLLLLGLAAYVFRTWTEQPLARAWTIGLATLAIFVLFWGYFSIFECLWEGQTPGKRRLQLRVMDQSGRAATPVQILTRNFIRAADFLPAFYGVGAICMLCNSRARRLGDLAAGTLVVHERERRLPPLAHAPQAETASAVLLAAARQITSAEQELVERFLLRCPELDYLTKSRLADKIAAQLTRHAAIEASRREWEDAESWLAALARLSRGLGRS